VTTWKPTDPPLLISATNPASPAAEAYRTLRASLQFVSADSSLQVLQFTSPSATEGKTTTVANLGVALSTAGIRVCVCCCDLRRPRLHEFFDVPDDIGVVSVLRGEVPLSKAIRRVPGFDRLWILPAGDSSDTPAEILSSKRMVDLMKAVRLQFDMVLIDSPPVLPVADSLILSRLVDASFLVATVGKTTRRGLRRSVELLRGVDAPLIGTILNGIRGEAGYGYGDGYYAYYASTPRQKDRDRVPAGAGRFTRNS
jgi:capsular exopolysaccharide synthesis family protein